ncbi:MAG TPA: hypothetical protein P5218_07010, partial [Planctomycetota bacterium]|nr:hypothetical protein [Planctomycetota bacterium]
MSQSDTQQRLDQVAQRASAELQKAAGQQGFAEGLGRGLFWFALIPALCLGVQLVRYFQGHDPGFLAIGWVVALALVLPLLAGLW